MALFLHKYSVKNIMKIHTKIEPEFCSIGFEKTYSADYEG